MIGELKNKKLQDSFLTSHLTSSKPSIIYAMDSFHKKFKYLAVNYALGPLYTTYDRKSHIEANYTLDGSRSCDVVMKGRSAMCRYNASITPEYSIKQLWNLLAVCLEFLSLNINEKEETQFQGKKISTGLSDGLFSAVARDNAIINKRRCVEAAHHLIEGGLWVEASKELCSVAAICARAKVKLMFEVVGQFQRILSKEKKEQLAADQLLSPAYHYQRWVRNYSSAISTQRNSRA
jgi:hypothetical protein